MKMKTNVTCFINMARLFVDDVRSDESLKRKIQVINLQLEGYSRHVIKPVLKVS